MAAFNARIHEVCQPCKRMPFAELQEDRIRICNEPGEGDICMGDSSGCAPDPSRSGNTELLINFVL